MRAQLDQIQTASGSMKVMTPKSRLIRNGALDFSVLAQHKNGRSGKQERQATNWSHPNASCLSVLCDRALKIEHLLVQDASCCARMRQVKVKAQQFLPEVARLTLQTVHVHRQLSNGRGRIRQSTPQLLVLHSATKQLMTMKLCSGTWQSGSMESGSWLMWTMPCIGLTGLIKAYQMFHLS